MYGGLSFFEAARAIWVPSDKSKPIEYNYLVVLIELNN